VSVFTVLSGLKCVISVLLFCGGLCPALLQNVEFFRINADKGLSQTAIYSIKQISNEFVWIAAREGLTRNDGYSSKVCNYNPGYIYSISNLGTVYQDRRSNLLLGTLGGINKFDKRSEKLISFLVYKTWLFNISLVALVLLLTLLVYSYRIREIKKLHKVLEEQVEIRTKQLRENEEKLKQANASKDKFFSIIAHDLRNPFMLLLGVSKLLREDYDELSEEEKKDCIRQIEESSKHTYTLLENLLEWAKTKTDQLEIKKTDFDINEAIEENLKFAQKSGELKNIAINFIRDESVFVYADRNLLNTALRNLLSNAIKFTIQDGQIVITTQKTDNEAIVKISDTGVGIPKDKLEKLFLIEHKQSTPGTNKEIGSGLGLIICKEFVEKNGGIIWVESEINRGSEFYFTVPVSEKIKTIPAL